MAGLLGGFISSTAVAFTFARFSRQYPNASFPLAVGVVAACTVLNLRVLVAVVVLRPLLAAALLPYLVAPFLVGAIIGPSLSDTASTRPRCKLHRTHFK